MIKYQIKLGTKHENMQARQSRDSIYKPALAGMRCTKCPGEDTVISFKAVDAGGVKFIQPVISACCDFFEAKIAAKISSV